MNDKQTNKHKSAYTVSHIASSKSPAGTFSRKNHEIVPSDSYSETFSSICAVTIKNRGQQAHGTREEQVCASYSCVFLMLLSDAISY